MAGKGLSLIVNKACLPGRQVDKVDRVDKGGYVGQMANVMSIKSQFSFKKAKISIFNILDYRIFPLPLRSQNLKVHNAYYSTISKKRKRDNSRQKQVKGFR